MATAVPVTFDLDMHDAIHRCNSELGFDGISVGLHPLVTLRCGTTRRLTNRCSRTFDPVLRLATPSLGLRQKPLISDVRRRRKSDPLESLKDYS